MSRILKTSLVGFAVILWCASAWSATIPKYHQRVQPIRIDGSEDVVRPSTGHTWGRPVQFANSAAFQLQMGTTYYDYQHNGSVGRQVDHSGVQIQAAWMNAPGASVSLRKASWNRASVTGALSNYTLPNGSTIKGLTVTGPLLTPPQDFLGAVRPGYANFRMRPGGSKGVVMYHDAPETGGGDFWELQLDITPGGGVWAGGGTTGWAQAPQPYAGDGVIWPKMTLSTCGADMVVHTTASWSGADNETWYWRGIVNDVTGAVTWPTGPTKMLPWNVNVNISNVIEAQGNNVYLVMGYLVGTTNADVVYYKSTDCGLTWQAPVNITNFADSGPEGFLYESNAVIDPAGNLHVIFNTGPADGGDVPVNIYHWSAGTGLRLIASAPWINKCVNGTLNTGANNGAGGYALSLADVGLAVKPAGIYGADELLYAVWTQFGPTTNDCATVDELGTLGGMVNGEIYISVSSNSGLTWDRPKNVTGTLTPDCLPGDCLSEAWSTVASLADSGVYISYVEDTHAGPIVQGGGAWSESPYKVAAPEARPPVLEPVIAVTPTDYLELNANPVTGIPKTVPLNIVSIGNANLNYTVTVMSDNGGAAHVTVNGGPTASGTILAGGAPAVISVGYDAAGYPDPSEHHWRLEVISNDRTNDPAQGGSPIDVNLEVFAATVWRTCDDSILTTGLHQMSVSSCLEMGKLGRFGLGFFKASDSAEWMYSGSPVITYKSGPNTYAFHNAFMGLADRTRDENKSFRAQTPFNVTRAKAMVVGDSTYLADYAQGVSSSTDTTIGIEYQMIFPQKSNLNRGAIFLFNMRSLKGSPITNVHYGVAADVDVDPNAGENDGAGSEDKGYIAARGGTTDTAYNFFPNNNSLALFHMPTGSPCIVNNAPAAQVLANANYVVPNSAYDVDSLYMLFNSFGAAGTWGTNIHIDTGQQYGDVSLMLVEGYNKTLDPVTVTSWGYGIAVSDLGQTDLEATIAALRAVANVACQVSCLIQKPGDVNESGALTSADIIYLVNFVFKGQAAPKPCAANGDVNCSGAVTSADIIYMVNHVFKGQAAPCDICNVPAAMDCIP